MNISALFKKYNRQSIRDDGAVASDQFKKFASDVKSMLKTICKESGANLKDYSIQHYSISAFIEKNGKYCYIAYSVPRGDSPLDLESSDCFHGWLYRSAKSDTDYRGGYNRFSNLLNLQTNIATVLDE